MVCVCVSVCVCKNLCTGRPDNDERVCKYVIFKCVELLKTTWDTTECRSARQTENSSSEKQVGAGHF